MILKLPFLPAHDPNETWLKAACDLLWVQSHRLSNHCHWLHRISLFPTLLVAKFTASLQTDGGFTSRKIVIDEVSSNCFRERVRVFYVLLLLTEITVNSSVTVKKKKLFVILELTHHLISLQLLLSLRVTNIQVDSGRHDPVLVKGQRSRCVQTNILHLWD